MVCHFVKHLLTAKILFFLHIATIIGSKILGGTRSKTCPRQALLTDLSGSVGRTLQLVKITHIALLQRTLGGAEIPLQAEADFLIQENLLGCRDNPVGIQHVEVVAHGAQQVPDLQRENHAAVQGGLFHTQIDQLVGARLEVSHHHRGGIVAIQLHLPLLGQVESKAGICRAKEGVLVVNLCCALLTDDADGGVKLQTAVVVGIDVEGKGNVFAYRHFSHCHAASEKRCRAEIVVVHHLVAANGVEDGDDGELVFGADIVPHQGDVAAKACGERHIVAVAGLEVGIAHIGVVCVDVVLEGVELVVVGACDTAGVTEAKTFHHVGGVVAHKKGGEKVEIVLGDSAGGVIGVSVFAAQTSLGGQSEGELTGKGGIERPHMLVVVEGVVDRTAVDGVVAPILTTYNLVEHIVGVGERPLGTRLHHTASQHHALVVDFGTVDVDDVVVVEGEVIDRVVFIPRHTIGERMGR